MLLTQGHDPLAKHLNKKGGHLVARWAQGLGIVENESHVLVEHFG